MMFFHAQCFSQKKNERHPAATANLRPNPIAEKQEIRNSGSTPAPRADPHSRFDTALRRASQDAIPAPRGDIRTSARLKA
jgi:hypothetical protein